MTIVERDDLSLTEEIGYAATASPSIKGLKTDDLRAWLADVEWERGYVASPEGGGSADVMALGQHKDGQWVGIEGWCDYTGWGCQDGCDVYVADDRDEVVNMGLTQEGRARLDVEASR